MRVAVIGTGISGMVAAWLLHREHAITVFEADDRIGGHTHTMPVAVDGTQWPVDTGFIVFNDRTYPHFIRLLAQLGVASQPTTMSFSVRCEATGLEYCGTSLNTLFAQRRNLLRPSFLRMLWDILRFHREAPRLLAGDDHVTSLGAYLTRHGYSAAFIDHYIVPMGAAIWSAPPTHMHAFPVRHFVQFFHHHGMLTVDQRPQWRVVAGGSATYARALVAPFADRIRLQRPVAAVWRHPDRVVVRTVDGDEAFDEVVISVHGDQALRLLADPSPAEREILGAFTYQENEAVLHSDASFLPRRRRAWAAWNYHLPRTPGERVAVSYHMNALQGLQARREFLVTLNPHRPIDPAQVHRRLTYHHPLATAASVAAQRRHAEINHQRRTSFCGAYWGFGFHEDGVVSALNACRHFGVGLP